MEFELCIESYESARIAAKHGLHRIELCSALALGGLTPSSGLIEKCTAIKGIEVHVMIRPRPGDFQYSADEFVLMQREIVHAAMYHANGVVIGCLTADGSIDLNKTSVLVDKAKSLNLDVTFHRAFDFVKDPINSLEQLIDLTVDRLLTSGTAETAFEGLEMLENLVLTAQQKIQVMAGSGVNASNVREIAQIGVDALHFSAHKAIGSDQLSMGIKTIPDEQKIVSILNQFK